MRRALVVNPLPRDASDITALGALALDQPRDLFLAAVRHRVQFGVRVRPNRFKDGRQKPFKRFAFGGRGHLAFKAKCLRHPAEWSLVAVFDANACMDQFMREDASYPHAIGDHW